MKAGLRVSSVGPYALVTSTMQLEESCCKSTVSVCLVDQEDKREKERLHAIRTPLAELAAKLKATS